MSNKRKLNRSGAVLATGALLGASLVAGVTGTASAEEFDPANAAPTVSIDTSTLTMSPDSGVGDNIYTIAATVGDANSLLDLNTVTLCLYKVGAPNAGDASCATQDPQSTAKITWTRSIDEFDVDASSGTESSNWELGTGGDAEPSTNNASYSYSAYSASGTSMTMQYRFRVSDVATEGTDWAVRVVAADGDTTTTANDTTGFSVNWMAESPPSARATTGLRSRPVVHRPPMPSQRARSSPMAVPTCRCRPRHSRMEQRRWRTRWEPRTRQ